MFDLKRKKTSGFTERTLLEIVSALKSAVSDDETASRAGLLQRRDPRFKLAALAFMLAGVLISGKFIGLGTVYILTLVLVALSSISPFQFLRRTLPFIPLFSLFVAVPAIFAAVTPGDVCFSFFFFGVDLSVTRQGLSTAGIFCLRVLDSVSLVSLAALTTRHHVMLKVLRVFGLPQLFVMILGMTYRYIYLLLEMVQHSFIALKSRVGFVSSAKTCRRIVGANMGNLWLRSYRLQTEVYSAMLSRGYSGEPVVIDGFRSRPADFILVAVSICIFVGLLWLNRYSL